MGLAQYAIVAVGEQWGVLHDGDIKAEYATREAAFESAAVAASLAIRQGHEVHLSVPARDEAKVHEMGAPAD
jgi:phosphotransferase system HPr-like phosphotransfer protein